jgi:hypothetical protein
MPETRLQRLLMLDCGVRFWADLVHKKCAMYFHALNVSKCAYYALFHPGQILHYFRRCSSAKIALQNFHVFEVSIFLLLDRRFRRGEYAPRY